MISEPIINNSLRFQVQSEQKEKNRVEEKIVVQKDESKSERIFSKRKENLISPQEIKEKNTVKINLYFCVLIIFLVGVVVGSIVFRILIEEPLVKETVIDKFSTLEFENKNEAETFKISLDRNVKLLATYWVVGISVVGAPLLVLLCFYKGFTTAFVISSFLLKFGFIQGNIYIFEKLFLYYLFLILAVILLTASSVKVMINILKHKKDIRFELVRHSIFTIIGFILMVISSFIETKFL